MPALYHPAMRRGLHFLLVVVLILRGLAGTAMAAGVLPPLAPALSTYALAHGEHGTHGLHAGSVTADDARQPVSTEEAAHSHDRHHGLAVAAAAECGECAVDVPAHSHHSTVCAACEICHSAMLDIATRAMSVPPLGGSAQPIVSVPFDSAPTALAIKPPIS